MNKDVLTLLVVLLISGISQAKSDRSNSLQWQFAYDKQGRIITQTDPAQRKTKFEYIEDNNALKSMVETRSDGAKTIFDFDEFERLQQATGNGQNTHYEYDGFSRLKTVRRAGQPSINYGFDSQDRINTVKVGNMVLTATAFDFLGRVDSIETQAGLIRYDYQSAQAKVVRYLPNGFYTVIEKSPSGRINSITHANENNVVLLKFSYHYKADGLIEKVEEYSAKTGNKTLQYQYDNVQRLVSSSDSVTGTTSYRYDALGNRLEIKNANQPSIKSQLDWAGRLTHLKGQTVDHDLVGNLISLPGSKNTTQFEYSANNALKAVNFKSGHVTYDYDAHDFMIKRSFNHKTTTFIPNPLADNWQPLLAKHTDGSKTMYIWEGSLLLASITGDRVQFYLHDHLGSIRAVVDGNTNRLNTFDYDPFGQPLQAVQSSKLQPGFASLFYDPQAALYLTKARGYSPKLGRFLQLDPQHRIPLGAQKDLSAYVYCGNDPVNYVDLDGNSPESFYTQFKALYKVTLKPSVSKLLSKINEKWLGNDYDFSETLWDSAKYAKKSGKYLKKAMEDKDFPAFYDLLMYLTKIGAKGTLAGTAAGQILIAKDLNTALYKDIRSAFDQRHSENLITLPLGVSRQIRPTVTRTAYRNHGKYEMTGRNAFSASGKWVRDGSDISMQSNWKVNNAFLHTGARFSGSFNKWVDRRKSGTAITTRSSSKSRYRETFNGAQVNKQIEEFNRTGIYHHPPAIKPTNVGGVYLRGAGKALAGFENIKGISIDEKTGRLVLLSKTEKSIGLPSLRLDDVVTIFRCVYRHSAPFVSIDPVPSNPSGPIMDIKHSSCTANTYAGWILLETDRLMKSYSLGENNVSRKAIQSKIPDYQNLLQLGFSNQKTRSTQPLWERFWIVPDQMTRNSSKNEQLSLFSVPLKVNTQLMEMHNGLMRPAKKGQSSQAATDFRKWFTKHYNEIAAENCLINPTQPKQDCIPVFSELRRIALITAIAERLLDQNVPIPVWMLNYKVTPFAMDQTTPAIVVESSKGRKTHSIYGGVELSGLGRVADTKTNDPIANKLLATITSNQTAMPLLTSISISEGKNTYQAVALPGNETQAIGANQLDAIDLSVLLPSGHSIALTRSSHSFFKPQGVFGRGWTMNLPRLLALKKPVKRTNKGISYRSIFQLTSSLNSYSEMFAKIANVKEVNGKIMVPEKSSEIIGLTKGTNKKIGRETDQIIFQDKRSWHFNKDGYLIAKEFVPMTIVYRRDAAHKITRIEGWLGDSLRADIKLHYQADGKLETAVASNDETVSYQYDDAGYLTSVKRGKVNTEYQYQNGLLSSVSKAGKIIHEFSYNDQGQLISEQLADGTHQRNEQRAISGGVEITVKNTKTNKGQVSRGYDNAYRPLYIKYLDGSRKDWQYTSQDASKTTYTDKQGQQYSINSFENGMRQTLHTPEGGTVTEEFDDTGRLIARFQDNQPVLKQKWQNGLLSAVETKTSGLYPQYDNDGVLDNIMLAKPVTGKTYSQWMNIQLDGNGRANEITDFTGNKVQIAYDQQGKTALIKSPQGAVGIERDQAGRVKQVKTSWGMQLSKVYKDKTDDLEQVSFLLDGKPASIHFNDGKVDNISQFDGSKINYRYYENQNHQGQVREIQLPNKLNLNYDYDKTHRISTVNMSDRAGFHYTYNDNSQLIGLEYRSIK